jgi:hypothetical protein
MSENNTIVGGVLQVKFMSHREDIKGVNENLTKIAFIDRSYKGPRPQPGDEWMCWVKGDSKPQEPKRGAFFLFPLHLLKPEMQWSIEWPAVNEQEYVEVRWREMLGERELDTQSWRVASLSDLQSDWPERVTRPVASYLKRYVQEQKARKKLTQREEQRQLLLNGLKNPSGIWVTAVSSFEHLVTVQAKHDLHRNHEVFVDGEYVGRHDSWAALRLTEFPLTIHGRRLELSNGNSITVYSHALQVIRAWNLSGGRWNPEKQVVFACMDKVNVGGRQTFNWDHVRTHLPGEVVGYEYPFQWTGEWLTNGVVWFPRQRPEGIDWKDYPIGAVPRECWEIFLAGLEGKFLDELIPYHREILGRKSVRSGYLPTERQKQLYAVITGKMWHGHKDCKRVSVGRNVVFHVTCAGGKPLYVLDNPGVGSIYLFRDLEKAMELAEGKITRNAAIEKGYERIIHSEGWEERLAGAFAA